MGMSADGKRIIIGAPYNDGKYGINSGHAHVYQERYGTWFQVRQDLDGEGESNYSGHSVGISADGARVIIGAPYNCENGVRCSGHARVYQERYGTWVQVGKDLDGEGNIVIWVIVWGSVVMVHE